MIRKLFSFYVHLYTDNVTPSYILYKPAQPTDIPLGRVLPHGGQGIDTWRSVSRPAGRTANWASVDWASRINTQHSRQFTGIRNWLLGFSGRRCINSSPASHRNVTTVPSGGMPRTQHVKDPFTTTRNECSECNQLPMLNLPP